MADNRSDYDKVLARWGELQTERSSWISHWQDVSQYIHPRSGRFMATDTNSGERRNNSIYDNTGTRALRVLGAGLMGGATSPARPWFRLTTPDPDLAKYAPVKQWLAEVTSAMRSVFAKSNTYRALHMIYEELGAYGTSASFLMDDYDTAVHHYVLTAGEYALACDYKGTVDTMAREYEKSVGAVVREFGYENCSARTKNLYDNGSYDKKIRIIHMVEPRMERDVRKSDNRNMPFKSCHFEVGSEKTYLRESGFKSFRALAPRWHVMAGDTYGNSPGMEALGDIRQLQHEQLCKAMGIDYQSDPPVQVPSALKNRDVDRLPGGITFYDSTGPQAGIRTLFDVNLRIDHLLGDIIDVRERINSTFYTDLFLMLANQQNTRMTATEVAERHEEKLLMIGPVLERIHNELLDPLITLTFERMLAARGADGKSLVPPPPEDLQGIDLNVEFVSMLAQAQKAVNTNSIDRFVTSIGAIAGAKPGVLDKFDEDKWADHYADLLGVDPSLVVPDEKVALVRKQRAAAQQQAAQQQQVAQSAETASKLASADTSNKNALTDVIGMFSGYSTPAGGQ